MAKISGGLTDRPVLQPRLRLGLAALGLSLACISAAQAQTPLAKPSAAVPATPAPAAPLQAESKLQSPPTQASIETQANSLTIRADNASLTQTLQRLADKTGMHLEGVSGDQRVFGDFGPGAPRDVLSTLLTGTGYNVVMIGALGNGAPRQLILSQKKADATSAQPQTQVHQQPVTSSDDDTPDTTTDDTPVPQQIAPPQHGGENGTGPGSMRTPQQMLQQMQQMRQQADQQATP